MSVEGQDHFLTLAQGHLCIKIKNMFFSETNGPFLTKFCILALRYLEVGICWYDAGHMTKMAAMAIYGKKPFKIFFSGTSCRISTKLGM